MFTGVYALGRPTLCTSEVTERMEKALQAGAFVELAIKAAGVSKTTHYRWMREGEAGNPTYVEYYERCTAADSHAAIQALEVITRTAQTGTWQAAAWLLERRHGYVKPEWRAREEPKESIDEPQTPEEAIAKLAKDVPPAMLEAALKKARAA